MRQRLHGTSWSGRAIGCRRFRLTSFRGLASVAGAGEMRLRPSLARGWVAGTPACQAGVLDPGERGAEVVSVFALREAGAAFERVAGRGKRGKVVLEVGTE